MRKDNRKGGPRHDAGTAKDRTLRKREKKRKLSAALLLAALLFSLAAAPAEAAQPDMMKITAIDLGADNTGEATMVTDGSGRSLLVDSGDPNNDAVFRWLDRNGYSEREFDTLVTHWHDDHAGNTARIVARYNIGTVYLPPTDYLYTEDTPYYRYERSYAKKIIDAAKKKGIRVVYLREGQVISVGTVKGSVLYCCGSPRSENTYSVQYINNQSAAIMFRGGGVSFLAAGDIQTEAEDRLIASGKDLRADIFKMSHHGLDTSNGEAFIKAVSPKYAYFTSHTSAPEKFISEKVRNSVERMMKVSDVLGTRYNGTIVFTCAGGKTDVKTERNGKGERK